MMFEPGGEYDILSSTGTTTGDVQAIANIDGSMTTTIDTSSVNGFSWVPGSPAPILTDMFLRTSADGTVSIDPNGMRSSYPSMEVWTYQTGKDPYNLLYLPETTPSDLGALNQNIPDVSNNPGSASTVVSGSDLGAGLDIIGSDPGLILGGGGGGGGGGGDWASLMEVY